jgi:protein-S-isoprenylcysteine O-methyltransferase Ste14
MPIPLSKLRLLVVWLLIPPFLYFAQPRPALLLAGAAIALVGIAIRAWAAGTIVKNRELATGGPYALSRNPLYLGSFLLGLGLAVAAGHPAIPIVYVGTFLAFYLPLMRQEERKLEGLFGAAFHDYAARVPLFVPRPAALLRAETAGFERSRYLGHKEWQALLGAAAGFAILALRMYV